MRVQGLRFAPVGPKPRSTGPRGPRCLLLSRFSSAGRASALQAEGPRFDPWNRDDGSFPIRLGESTPLTRRPKGKRLVPFFGKCGHGVIGSIPVFQTGDAGSSPVVHFPPSWRNVELRANRGHKCLAHRARKWRARDLESRGRWFETSSCNQTISVKRCHFPAAPVSGNIQLIWKFRERKVNTMYAYASVQCRHQHIQRRISRWQIRLFVMPKTDTRNVCTGMP